MTAVWLLSLVFTQYLSDLPMTTMSFDARELKEAFNSSQDRVRVVTVLSPT